MSTPYDVPHLVQPAAPPAAGPIRLGVVGHAWRAEFFLRLAQALPEHVELVGIVARRQESREEVSRRWGVPAYPSVSDLVREAAPDLAVSSVTWAANPGVVSELVSDGVPVLCETPPAPDLPGLTALWDAVGDSGMVQVAEQYLRLPGHAARLELVNRGVIGDATSVQVSSTHGYHAVSMMRGLLGAGFGPVSVLARSFTAPLVDPLSRDGWTRDNEPHDAATVLATLDFGAGRSGLYDFTDNQWHNQLRARRIVIRGTRGEIVDESVIHLGDPAVDAEADPQTIVRGSLVRYQTGHDLNLDGHDTEQISLGLDVLWRNRFSGLRLMDEEIAIASLMLDTAAWVRDGRPGPGPYPLAQASQDHLVSLAIDEALATGQLVTTTEQPWANG
jgi:predicted dehydrogenase